MGVWIEILNRTKNAIYDLVTPRVGVWIEMAFLSVIDPYRQEVTPRVGVWIEIAEKSDGTTIRQRHSPCGSVD